MKEKRTKNSEQVHANLETKVYFINFSKPFLHFLLGKLEFVIKHKKMQMRNIKCKNHQIFRAKIVTSSLMPIGS